MLLILPTASTKLLMLQFLIVKLLYALSATIPIDESFPKIVESLQSKIKSEFLNAIALAPLGTLDILNL